ncbi:MAG TPA: hypothetical protein VJ728_17460 [Candidatus Binataceae bacterium]|nr:hypothetical protein [Candidatus Binataceae bacterium]
MGRLSARSEVRSPGMRVKALLPVQRWEGWQEGFVAVMRGGNKAYRQGELAVINHRRIRVIVTFQDAREIVVISIRDCKCLSPCN